MLGRYAEEPLVAKLVGTGSRKGSTPFGRFGDIMQRPPAWAAMAGALALCGGERGRQAAARGAGCYLAAVGAHLPIKALVGRKHPKGFKLRQLGPLTSSFPSGHAAADVAFVLGASQAIPLLVVPLSLTTTAVHWALVRKRSHYPSDVIAGGLLGVVVAVAAWKLWPPSSADNPGTPPEPA